METFQLPKPGKALGAVLAVVAGVWLLLAIAINWVGISAAIVRPFAGSSSEFLSQPWCLLTAPFIHVWSGDGAVSHVLTTLFALYFLGPPLEDRWGPKKMAVFLVSAGVLGFLVQMALGAVVPQLRQDIWFGGLGMADAVAVAWALNARSGSQVRLFFVLPVSPMMLLAFIVGMNVLTLIAAGSHPEGLATPFGGMLFGAALSDRSPLRKAWLKMRLQRLQAEVEASKKRSRAAALGLRVVQGGAAPKDKRFLN